MQIFGFVFRAVSSAANASSNNALADAVTAAKKAADAAGVDTSAFPTSTKTRRTFREWLKDFTGAVVEKETSDTGVETKFINVKPLIGRIALFASAGIGGYFIGYGIGSLVAAFVTSPLLYLVIALPLALLGGYAWGTLCGKTYGWMEGFAFNATPEERMAGRIKDFLKGKVDRAMHVMDEVAAETAAAVSGAKPA